MPYTIYILKCSDGSYYTGSTKDLEGRVREHQAGEHPDSYTYSRRPVQLVWSEITDSYSEAFQWEHRIKGWSRAKKESLIRGDIEGIHEIVKAERKRREKNKNKKPRTERSKERSDERRRSVRYVKVPANLKTCTSSARQKVTVPPLSAIKQINYDNKNNPPGLHYQV